MNPSQTFPKIEEEGKRDGGPLSIVMLIALIAILAFVILMYMGITF